jgi:hypothetical protein
MVLIVSFRITELFMSVNDITDKGTVVLAKAVATNKSLEVSSKYEK